MPTYSGSTDHTNLIRLEPTIVRAYWSRPRAWNGADVVLRVETRWVPDDTELKISVFEDDTGEGSADDFIADVEGPHKVRGNRCEIPWTLRFDAEVLGQERATEGAEYEFYFLVKLERFKLTMKSNLLYVDLGGFEVSR